MMMKTNELYILIQIWITLTFVQFQGLSCVRNIQIKNLVSIFLLSVNLDEIQYVAATCWFVEDHAKFILHE